ncbi:MAG: hypothetical protein GX558_04930, partial [Clostridiales bacterium]|nr:hypothetical protein [Clostridiales bacterium]
MIRTQRTFFDRSLSRAFRRRLAREGARGWAARRLLVGGVLFLCCQARLAGDMAPFAPACFAAGLSAGWSPPAMLVGVALGALAAGGSSSALPMASPMAALMMPLGCGLIWALWKALQRLAPRFPRGASGRDEGLPSEDAWVAGLAGLAALPPAIAGSPSPAAAVCALIAAPLAPTLTSALRVGPGRRLLMPDERLSLTLLMMVLVAGVHALPLIGQPLGLAAAALLSLAAAGLGPAAGAVGGLSLGLAIAATGGDAAVGAVLGLSAMAAGAVRGLARPAQAASFVACALVAASYLSGGQAPGGAAIAPIALAALGYCLIPLPPLKRAWTLLDPRRRRRVDPERLGQRLGDGAQRRVHGVAAV